jgi:hypothetical protein
MSVQLRLNLSIDFTPRAGDTPSKITERFEAFHRANPEVFDELARLARIGKAQGRGKLGVKELYEVLRWTRTVPESRRFRLCNDFHSRYARMLDAEPDLAGLFDLRELRA